MVFADGLAVFVPVWRAEQVAGYRAPVDDLEFALRRFGVDFLGDKKFVELRVDRRGFRGSLVLKGQVERLGAVEGLCVPLGVRQILCEHHEPLGFFEDYFGDVEELVGALRGLHYV